MSESTVAEVGDRTACEDGEIEDEEPATKVVIQDERYPTKVLEEKKKPKGLVIKDSTNGLLGDKIPAKLKNKECSLNKKEDGKQGGKRTIEALATDLPPSKKLASENNGTLESSDLKQSADFKNKDEKGKTFEFKFMRAELLAELEGSFVSGEIENIKKKYTSFTTIEGDKRASFDHAFRDKLYSLLKTNPNDVTSFERLMDLSMNLCKNDLLTPVFPVLLLSDIFDMTTIATSEKLFSYVEKNVKTWKEPSFFTVCKNSILRMCNDLLRRLSKTHNTIFCGRILMFLAMFFPFSERSGLNIVSEFNVDSVVEYEDKPSESCEDLSDNIAQDLMEKVNDGFHSKFWSLQKFFRSPVMCYNPSLWKEFVRTTNEVLSIFHNYKLDSSSVPTFSEKNKFFTNFLTNKKLLVHQLSDVQFRRTIYVQFLIVFQFLNAHVKSKQDSHELTLEQAEWAKETTELIFVLIKETPPDGERFLSIVQFILNREELWNKWKNDGCPAPSKLETEPTALNTTKVLKHKRELGDSVRDARQTKRIRVSYSGTEREYIIEEKYDDASRNLTCVPDTEKFFDEAIVHLDPAAQIEPQYRKTNDVKFCWMALKLLAMRSEYFFTIQPIPIPSMSEYVEIILKRIHRDKNPSLCLPPLMGPPKIRTVKSPVKASLSAKSKVLLAQEKIQAAITRAKSRPKLPDPPKEDFLTSDSGPIEPRLPAEVKPNLKSSTVETKLKSISSSKTSQKTKAKDDVPKSKDDSVIKSKTVKEVEQKARSQTPSPALKSEPIDKKPKIEPLLSKPKSSTKTVSENSKTSTETKSKSDSSKSKTDGSNSMCPPPAKNDGTMIKSKEKSSAGQKTASTDAQKSAPVKPRSNEVVSAKPKSESISVKPKATSVKTKNDSKAKVDTSSKPKSETTPVKSKSNEVNAKSKSEMLTKSKSFDGAKVKSDESNSVKNKTSGETKSKFETADSRTKIKSSGPVRGQEISPSDTKKKKEKSSAD